MTAAWATLNSMSPALCQPIWYRHRSFQASTSGSAAAVAVCRACRLGGAARRSGEPSGGSTHVVAMIHHPHLPLTVQGRQRLPSSGDVTLRGQHQPDRERMSGSAGRDATLLPRQGHRMTTTKTHRNSATRH